MYLDAQNLYSDSQALSASAASTNVIDHRVGSHFGIGEPLVILVTVDEGGDLDDTDGDETYTVKVQTDDNEDFDSPTDVFPAYSLPRGSAAGTRFVIPFPDAAVIEQYTRLYFTLGGATPSGQVTAALLPANFVGHENVYYPEAITFEDM